MAREWGYLLYGVIESLVAEFRRLRDLMKATFAGVLKALFCKIEIKIKSLTFHTLTVACTFPILQAEITMTLDSQPKQLQQVKVKVDLEGLDRRTCARTPSPSL